MRKILIVIFAAIISIISCSCGKGPIEVSPIVATPTTNETIINQTPKETVGETITEKLMETQLSTEAIIETQAPTESKKIKKIKTLKDLNIKIKGESVSLPCEVSKIIPKNYELVDDVNNLESEGVIVIKTIRDTKSSDGKNNIDLHINYDIKNKHEVTTEKLLKSQCFGFRVEKASQDCVTINGFGCGDNVRELMETIHDSCLVENYTHKSSGESKMFIVRYKFKEVFVSLSGNDDIIEKISVVYDNSKK